MAAFTDQQLTAVTSRNASVVLSSGAGCGKTAVLTARYLSHLENDRAGVHQLVAITFTDRAAREMRRRIRSDVEAKLRAASGPDRDWWREQLRGLESAPVCTIHSFCATLLRHYGLSAGVDPRFAILEEVIAPNLRDDAVTATLSGLLTQESPDGEALRYLVRWYGWSAVREVVTELLDAPDRAQWDKWSNRTPDQIAAEHARQFTDDIWPAWVRHRIRPGTAVARCLEVLRRVSTPPGVMAERVGLVLSELPKLADAEDPAAFLEPVVAAARVQGGGSAKTWADPDEYAAVRDAFTELRDALKAIQDCAKLPDDLLPAAQVGQQFLKVATACDLAFAAEKRRRGYLDFQDLLVGARDLLHDRADVRRDCQNRYRFLLVDELQDTDAVQMELIGLLCGRGQTKGKLFAVGDAKQSIYRFRGAVVELFDELRAKMPEAGRQSLSVNFRSQPGILHFTNALLCDDMPGYEPLTPHVPAVNPGPCVEFLWGPGDGSAAENRQAEAGRIARRIAAMVGKHEMLVTQRTPGQAPTLRPVKLGDVVILSRAMTNAATYESALREAGLDYYLVGGRAFYAQQEVFDLLNLLKALDNPHDSLALVAALRSAFGCVSDDGLVILCSHENGPWAGLHDEATRARLPRHDRSATTRVSAWFDAWRSLKDRLPVAGLLNRILDDCGYDAALMNEFLGDRKLANLWKLIDQARAFDAAGPFGIGDFIRRLEHLVDHQPREEQAATMPESADVVRLMSIHQAKGLEFPVVVLADFNAQTGGRHAPVATFDRRLGCVVRPPADEEPPPFADTCALLRMREEMADWHEDLRTLYVACTRAMDYLVLSGSGEKPANTAMRVLTERFDLATGRFNGKAKTSEGPAVVLAAQPEQGVFDLRRRAARPRPLTERDAIAVQAILADRS
jgi:ATP-dependent helicase/nuclease subunit A